jgi:hypothetical protein
MFALKKLSNTLLKNLFTLKTFKPNTLISIQSFNMAYEEGTQKMVCFNCKKEGHMARNCTEPKLCKACGQPGHFYKDCTQGNSNRNMRCLNCGENGHTSTQCPKGK